jgi:hypothetical protein
MDFRFFFPYHFASFFYANVIPLDHIDVMVQAAMAGGVSKVGTSHEGDSISNVHMDKSIDLEVDRA